jgi:hypothetical protein
VGQQHVGAPARLPGVGDADAGARPGDQQAFAREAPHGAARHDLAHAEFIGHLHQRRQRLPGLKSGRRHRFAEAPFDLVGQAQAAMRVHPERKRPRAMGGSAIHARNYIRNIRRCQPANRPLSSGAIFGLALPGVAC